MKPVFLLVLAGLLILGAGSASMAAAVFSGEIEVAAKGADDGGSARSFDYAFGKMVLNGALGEDLTGVLVFKADPVSGPVTVDEAYVTFSEAWGSLKLGYYDWNNNLTDIVASWAEDIKSETGVAATIKLSDSFTWRIDYAYTGSAVYESNHAWISRMRDLPGNENRAGIVGGYRNPYGAGVSYSGGIFGADFIYYHYHDAATAWGGNLWATLGGLKPFFQYRNFQNNDDSKIFNGSLQNDIVGIMYEPGNLPITLRGEVDLSRTGFLSYYDDHGHFKCDGYREYDGTPWGVRIVYRLSEGAQLEAQYKATGYNEGSSHDPVLSHEYYVKLIANF